MKTIIFFFINSGQIKYKKEGIDFAQEKWLFFSSAILYRTLFRYIMTHGCFA
jgi:hypothetical protein